FQAFVVPHIEEHIRYSTPISSVDCTHDTITLSSGNKTFEADWVVITVPVSVLKEGDIQFTPPLPDRKLVTFEEVVYWDGFKAFIEFEEKFYPAFVDYLIRPETEGQVSFYDAAWGQDSAHPVLGLFSVGTPAAEYGSLSKEDFKKRILSELDAIFDGQASQYYVQHLTQHWADEPFAKGAYINDYASPFAMAKLQEPVADRLFFAGDGYTDGTDWGNVHNAIRSAQQCVDTLLNANQ
ncbi:MAG: FAD-dependent oxidoreductase, partial [Bacteroidota bacterium]